ncbi:hypothetical protein VNO77_44839 [Canavalia gladiata]|uniref:Uncharacterized protein n=1 Tax=Canavalia gladiata TaxID=3824 RepID=A0AAN9K0D8_CANGL
MLALSITCGGTFVRGLLLLHCCCLLLTGKNSLVSLKKHGNLVHYCNVVGEMTRLFNCKIPEAMCYTDVFFALTIPMGTGIGIGINHVNDESSPTSLSVECCIGRDLN